MASLNKKVNNQGKEDRIPRKVGISERVASAIVNRRKALLNKLGIGNHSCSQPRQSPPERRQDASPQQMQSKQMQSHQMRSAPVPFRVPILTVKKNLCATSELPHMPQNYGPQYKTRTALNQTLSGPGHRNRNMSNQSSASSGGRGEVNINSSSALPKKMEDKALKSTTEHLVQQLREDRIPRKIDSSERVPSDIVIRREALLKKLGMDGRSRSQPRQSPPESRQDAPPQQMQGRGEVNINSYYALPKKMEDKALKGTTEHLEQQLKGLYVGPDKSDSSPTYPTPPEEFPPRYKRSKCQRPGGCPDGMFGNPAKKNLCYKCWIEVRALLPATQRAPSADQGKYDMTYAGRA